MENKIVNRNGEILKSDVTTSMNFLYENIIGRVILKILVSPIISKIVGGYLNTRFSLWLIQPFVKKNHINLEEYENVRYKSYNEFFYRQIKDGKRKINKDQNCLISPCDSKVTYYKIDDQMCFRIKNSLYTIKDLIQNDALAKEYIDGVALVFRLSVDDYHRYCFIDEGKLIQNYKIKGILHTVNPIASYHYPIYKTNSREVSVLETHHFGQVIYMEVGAMMVGKINNLNHTSFKKGEVKGWFEFGGSTVVLLFKKDNVIIDEDIVKYSLQDIEVRVKMGEQIGKKAV